MRTSHDSGHDGTASFYSKIPMPVVSESLCDPFNKLSFTGKFLEDWKIVRVPLVLKNDAKDDRSKYSPISILPFVTKLYEKLVVNPFCVSGCKKNYCMSISLVFDF